MTNLQVFIHHFIKVLHRKNNTNKIKLVRCITNLKNVEANHAIFQNILTDDALFLLASFQK